MRGSKRSFDGFSLCLAIIFALAIEMAWAEDKPEVFVQMGHTHAISSVAFSPDGKYAFSASEDTTVKLWDVASGREIRTFSGSPARITAIAVSPDGNYLASADAAVSNNIELLDIASGKAIRTFSGHEGGMEGGMGSLVFAPDGKHILSTGWVGGRDNAIKLWDVASGEEIRTFSGSSAPVSSIAVTPDGKYVISGSWDNSVSAEQDADGNFVETRAKNTDNAIRVWDFATGRQVRAFHQGGGWVGALAVTPDGKYVISGHSDDSARMWEIASGKEVKVFAVEGVSSIAISPDGKYALFGSVGKFALWNIATAEEIRVFENSDGWVRSVAFSPDGKLALSGDGSNNPKLWDIASGRKLASFGGYASEIKAVAMSRDENLLASGYSHFVSIWNIPSASQLRITEHSLLVASSSISNDGSLLGAGGWDPASRSTALKIWDLASGKERQTIARPGVYWAQSMAIAPDGKSVLWSDYDTLRLSDIATGKEIKSFSGERGFEIKYAAVSSDGKYAVSNDTATANIWDIESGKIVKSFKNEAGSQVVCSDGKRVLVLIPDYASGNLVFTLWDIAANKEIKTLKIRYDAEIFGKGWRSGLAAMNADGRYVLAASGSTLFLWDMLSGTLLKTFSGHSSDVTSIGISRDERYAYSGSRDGTARLWDIASGKEIAQLISFADGEWVAITPEGYFNASLNGAKHLTVRSGNNVYGIDQFYARFYRPELVQLALAGKEIPRGELLTEIAAKKPAPAVQILSPAGRVDQDQVSVTLKITDRGGGIGRVNVYINGAQVANDTRSLAVAETGSANEKLMSFTIPLVPGENEIRVVAFNGENSMESNPALLGIVSNAAPRKPDLYALVVGINTYRNQSISLTYAVPDATAFAGALQKIASPLFGVSDIRTLVTPEDTTKDAITKAFAQVRQKIKPNDLFIFYDASHGTVDVINGEEQYFLLTSNVRLLSSRHISEDALSHKDLVSLIGSIPAQKKLIILDTCNAGKGGKEIQLALLQQTRGLTDATAVKILQRAVGSSVFSASSDTQQANEGYEGHGLFTYALLEGMQGKADFKKDGFITVKGLALHTEERVMALSEEVFKHQQNPMIETGVNDFPIGKLR